MGRISIRVTIDERDLIINHTFAGDDLTDRLNEAKVGEFY